MNEYITGSADGDAYSIYNDKECSIIDRDVGQTRPEIRVRVKIIARGPCDNLRQSESERRLGALSSR
jgi:hypothetical protein